ncbi:MAG: hypothetical protein WA981_11055 [Glaciecola sp.]
MIVSKRFTFIGLLFRRDVLHNNKEAKKGCNNGNVTIKCGEKMEIAGWGF